MRLDRAGLARGLLAVAVLVSLPLPACGDADPARQSPDGVRAVVLPFLTHMPLHVAAAEGYFAEQNLDVELVRLGRIQEMMAALARGDVDLAAGFVTVNELNLIAGGVRVRLVAALAELDPDRCSFVAYVAHRDHLESGRLDDLEGLRGMRIDADPLTPLGYFVGELVRPAGLTLDDLELVDLPPAAGMNAMERRRVDLIVESEPFISMHESRGEATVWRSVGSVVPDYPHSVVMYGPRLLAERRDVGERFAVALLKGMRQYRRGKTPRNMEIVADASGLDEARLREACWPRPGETGRVDPAKLRAYQEWSLSRGLVDRVLAEEELFDHAFIEHADAVLTR